MGRKYGHQVIAVLAPRDESPPYAVPHPGLGADKPKFTQAGQGAAQRPSADPEAGAEFGLGGQVGAARVEASLDVAA